MFRAIKKLAVFACLLASTVSAELEDVKEAQMDIPLDPKFGQMFEWAKEQGCEFDAIELRHQRDSMRGMFAKRDIKKGETMLFVPDELVMSLEKGKESYFGKIMTEKKLVPGGYRLNAPTMAVMAIANLQEIEKGKDSKFLNHFAVQPGVEDFPVHFTEEERAYLKGSPFLEYLDQEIEDIRYDYSLIARDIPEFAQKYSKQDFTNAKLLVISRNFGVTRHGTETNIQVPIADMFNTRTPKNSLWYYDDTRNGFIVEAVSDIKQGEQLFDSYGKKCNYRFFLNYAFINLDDNGDNDENEFPITIGLNKNEETYEIKKEVFLDGVEKTEAEYRILGSMKEKVNIQFLAWIRFIVYDGDLDDLYNTVSENMEKAKQKAIKEGAKQAGSIADYIQPIDIHNEALSWSLIKSIADEKLAKYPTTLDEDYEILKNNKSLTYNTRNCVLLRVGEKKILHFMRNQADILLDMAKMDKKQAVKHMMKNHKALKKSMTYVKETFIPLLPAASAPKPKHDEL